ALPRSPAAWTGYNRRAIVRVPAKLLNPRSLRHPTDAMDGPALPDQAKLQAPPPVKRPHSVPDRILLPLIVATALFMENLDSTVLATALPAIGREFGESPIQLKLALTSYLLAVACALPASGW